MKTEIQMIVTDLDRSLLRNDKTISEYTIEIFRKCREKNIIIVFATARPRRSTMTFEKQICPNSAIYLNGAIVTVKQEILKRNSIKNLLAKEIIKNIGEKYPEATISAEMNDIMYTNFDFDSKTGYKKIEFNELPDDFVDKIIIGTIPVEKILSIKEYLTDELYLEINDKIYGFILNKNASKWNGIKLISEYFKIDIKSIISFGDDLNDISMLKNSGKGIAMENGLKEVKEIATDICEENEKDGIAKWLEKNIL